MGYVIQSFIVLFALFALSRAILRWRERTISSLQALAWALIWAVLILLVFIPESLRIVADAWDVGRAVDSLVYASVIALFYLVFRLYVKQEAHEQDLTKLVRHFAIENAKRPLSGATRAAIDSARKK